MINRRTEFQGSHLTPEVKEALRKQALRDSSTMSELVYKFLHEKLVSLGHRLPPPQQRKR
jgi:hypothetical protein